MMDIYRVIIHGRKLESRDLKQLLARAIREKKSLDQKLLVSLGASKSVQSWSCSGPAAATCGAGVSQ